MKSKQKVNKKTKSPILCYLGKDYPAGRSRLAQSNILRGVSKDIALYPSGYHDSPYAYVPIDPVIFMESPNKTWAEIVSKEVHKAPFHVLVLFFAAKMQLFLGFNTVV